MCYIWISVLLSILGTNDSARILGIFPTPSISHQLPFQAIMKALAARGHQITVISPDPLKVGISKFQGQTFPRDDLACHLSQKHMFMLMKLQERIIINAGLQRYRCNTNEICNSLNSYACTYGV